jgi:hypothetical protein
MATALLITYELKTKDWNYEKFYEALKGEGNWWHYLSSTWIVVTYKSPSEMHQVLGQFLSTKDLIFIVDIAASAYWGFLPKDAWDWIQGNVSGHAL